MRGTILVTGATGFVGRHVVPRLIERYGAERVVGVGSRGLRFDGPGAGSALVS